MVFYGLVLPCCGLVWILYGPVWIFYGLVWPFMAKYGSEWTCIVSSHGHRTKLIWSCFSDRRSIERRSERALNTFERERRSIRLSASAAQWWALSMSAPKITESERKLSLIFALKMESYSYVLKSQWKCSVPKNFRARRKFLKITYFSFKNGPILWFPRFSKVLEYFST